MLLKLTPLVTIASCVIFGILPSCQMGDRDRGRSRSRGSRVAHEGDSTWNEVKQDMYDALTSKVNDPDETVVSEAIDRLYEKGITTDDQLRNIPMEVLLVYFPPATHGRHLVFMNQVLAKYRAEDKANDPLAVAASSWAREVKNQRKVKEGRDADSSDDESKLFVLVDCLRRYGLQEIPSSHMQDTKLVKKQAKEAKNKHQSEVVWLPDPEVLKQIPLWMRQEPPPRKLASLENTASGHAQWVASWWSARLGQLAVQAYHETATTSFQDLLTEFLHVNQLVAQAEEPKVGWEYDRQVWQTLKANADNGKKDLKIKEALTVVSNDLRFGIGMGVGVNKPLDTRSKGKGKNKGKANSSGSRDTHTSWAGSADNQHGWVDPRVRTDKFSPKGRNKGAKGKEKKQEK